MDRSGKPFIRYWHTCWSVIIWVWLCKLRNGKMRTCLWNSPLFEPSWFVNSHNIMWTLHLHALKLSLEEFCFVSSHQHNVDPNCQIYRCVTKQLWHGKIGIWEYIYILPLKSWYSAAVSSVVIASASQSRGTGFNSQSVVGQLSLPSPRGRSMSSN